MKETADILQAFEQALKEGKQTALATLVHVEGSSYRRPGARMLVTEDGALTGAISGGCLEGDALRKALLAMSEQKNKLVTYDTLDEDDAKFGAQLGCNGIVYILFEPIFPVNENNAISLLQKLLGERSDAVVVTLFSLHHALQPGTCLLYRQNTIHTNLALLLYDQIMADVRVSFRQQTSYLKTYNIGDEVLNAFIEFVPPSLSILIAGAGNDVQPLVEICAMLGWQITVVDGRKTHADRKRFPKANQVIVAKPADVLAQVIVDDSTAFVLMTHNYNYDVALLKELLQTSCKYIGLLGPKKKLDRMLDEIIASGITISEQQVARIYGPVGLDIGAETPQEIALAIAAEIKNVFSKFSAISLKEKDAPIHNRFSSFH